MTAKTMTAEKKPHTLTMLSDTSFRVERIFNASRERVWAAMTQPELLAQWWGRGNKLDVEESNLVTGGRWRFVEHSDQGTFGFSGEYREIVPPERLVLTFGWDGMEGHVITNDMTLLDLGDGRTKLVSVSTFTTKADRDGILSYGMETGMAESYAALDALLARTA